MEISLQENKQNYRLMFVLRILLPLFCLMILGITFEITWLSIVTIILGIDGICGLCRSIKDKVWQKSDVKVIHNNWFPFGNYSTISLLGLIITKVKHGEMSESLIRHELTHKAQTYETGYILFYVLYVLEWFTWCIIIFFKLLFTDFKQVKETFHIAYKSICFEQEANYGEDRNGYVNDRDEYNWLSTFLVLD